MAKRRMAQASLNNLDIKENGWSSEEASKNGRKGGIRSGQARKEKADLKRALNKLLEMEPMGKTKENLEALGYDTEDMSNADALMCTLYAAAMQGDKKSAEMILQYGLQVSEDERKTRESEARINAIAKNMGEDMTVSSSDDGDGDVVIYLPKVEEEDATENN